KINLEEVETKPYEEMLKIIGDYFVERNIVPKVRENWNPNIQ
ncbi:glycerol acyltransferase, partial [Escherichia coli]|nr:glycerol acyltransferase [Escherichia coli]